MFKTDAIILRQQPLHEKKIRLEVFSKEFGVCSVWVHKKHIAVDIGDICQLGIERKNNVNIVAFLEPKMSIPLHHLTYRDTLAFLYLISYFTKYLKPGESYDCLFDEYRQCLLGITKETLVYQNLTLFCTRFFKKIGILHPKHFEGHPTLMYIYQKIDHTPITKILNASPLKEDQLATITLAHAHSIHIFHS